jgi:hypothetical protein
MALTFHRRLAIPCVSAVFAVTLAAPPPATVLLMPPLTLFVIALAAIAVLVAMPGAFPWLRTSRALARVRPSIQRDEPSTGSAMDGEGQVARPPV